MQDTQDNSSDTDNALHVGARVINFRRNAVGTVKSEPFTDVAGGDRRLLVWVDYTESVGVVAIDPVRELTPVHRPERNS